MDKVLYLPLTQETAKAVGNGLLNTLNDKHVSVLAGIVLLQKLEPLVKSNRPPHEIEVLLGHLLKMAVTMEEKQTGSFLSVVTAGFEVDSFNAGLACAAQAHVYFLPDKDVEERQFITREGLWNFEFCCQHYEQTSSLSERVKSDSGRTYKVSTDQVRSLNTLRAEVDEHLHVQALAGTGKTFLIERMFDALGGFRPLLLAMTKPQLNALLARVPAARGMTFGEFAENLLVMNRHTLFQRPGSRARLNYQLDDKVIAEQMGMTQLGNASPAQVAKTCRRIIMSFCGGCDLEINQRHIPNGPMNWQPLEREQLVCFAKEFWKETIFRNGTKQPLPIRSYHMLKFLSLQEHIELGYDFTHLVIDEAHDMPLPLIAFLDGCDKPVITLGDECQRLDAVINRRGKGIRQREMFQSVRAGQGVESLINPIIENNPIVQVHPLAGNAHRSTRMIPYDKQAIPPRPTTILVGSEWGLFEWFQRLAHAGVKFSMLEKSGSVLSNFASDCISLYHKHNQHSRPQSPSLPIQELAAT